MLLGFKAKNHPQQRAREDVDDRMLPDAEFWVLNRRFGFDVNAAASRSNHRLPKFWTKEEDGLSTDWSGLRVYCNPPFSKIHPWIEKAWAESNCPLTVMLLPANRTEQGFWQQLVEPKRDRAGSPLTVEFMPNRIRFKKPGQPMIGPNERPRFGCCLLIWNRAHLQPSTAPTVPSDSARERSSTCPPTETP